jgi:hypothetical protein
MRWKRWSAGSVTSGCSASAMCAPWISSIGSPEAGCSYQPERDIVWSVRAHPG